MRQVYPRQFVDVSQGIAAAIGISNLLRAFFMVCLNSSSSGSMKKIPRICLALDFSLLFLRFQKSPFCSPPWSYFDLPAILRIQDFHCLEQKNELVHRIVITQRVEPSFPQCDLRDFFDGVTS